MTKGMCLSSPLSTSLPSLCKASADADARLSACVDAFAESHIDTGGLPTSLVCRRTSWHGSQNVSTSWRKSS